MIDGVHQYLLQFMKLCTMSVVIKKVFSYYLHRFMFLMAGDNSRHSWQRPRGTSLDSVLSSVDMENFISRYSETLASQVLALVQKSLPSTAPS